MEKGRGMTMADIGRRSQAAQRERLGEDAYRKRQAAKGKRGGRPKVAAKKGGTK